MTFSTHSRTKSLIRTFSLALVASVFMAVVAPAAFADHKPSHQAPKNVTHRHFLKMYKVEKVLDIEVDDFIHLDPESHVYCDQNDPLNFTDNDLAVDGMWKITDVEQDDDGSRKYTDVKVFASYRDHVPTANYPGGNPSKWHFEFDNLADGRAQIKLYTVCLGYLTEPNSHRHQWTWSGVHMFNDSDPGPHPLETQESTSSPNNHCPSGTIAVSPGFQFDRTKSPGYIYRSGYSTTSFRDWTWGFWVEPGPFDLKLTFHCLDVKTLHAGSPSHLHELIYDFETGPTFAFPPPVTVIGPDPDGPGFQQSIETRERRCDSHEKGMVHYFDLDPHFMGHDLWFLGMDPRIKHRAYKIENKNAAARDARFGLMCFNDRTGKKKKN